MMGIKEVLNADPYISLDIHWILLPLPNLFLSCFHYFPPALSNGIVEVISTSRNRVLFIYTFISLILMTTYWANCWESKYQIQSS